MGAESFCCIHLVCVHIHCYGRTGYLEVCPRLSGKFKQVDCERHVHELWLLARRMILDNDQVNNMQILDIGKVLFTRISVSRGSNGCFQEVDSLGKRTS